MDYIHLNPVQAGIVPAEQIAHFRWSSLARFVKGPRPGWLSAGPWLNEARLEDSAQGWTHYIEQLISLASDPVKQEKRGFEEILRGRAISTHAWKQAVACEQRQRALELDLPRDEIRNLKEARWQVVLDEVLSQRGKNRGDVVRTRRSPRWKVELAFVLRRQAGAPYRWIAEKLQMGSPASTRVAVCRFVNM